MFLAVGGAAPHLARRHLLGRRQADALRLARTRLHAAAAFRGAAAAAPLQEASGVSPPPRASLRRHSQFKDAQPAPAPARDVSAGAVRQRLFASSVVVGRLRKRGETRTGRTSLSRASRRGSNREDAALCICCCRAQPEVLEAASFLQEALEPVIGRVRFVRSDPGLDNPVGIEAARRAGGAEWRRMTSKLCGRLSAQLLEGVANSDGVLLLQTRSAFSNALTLLQLYWAWRQQKPIICLRLKESPYDFAEMHRFLDHLETNLARLARLARLMARLARPTAPRSSTRHPRRLARRSAPTRLACSVPPSQRPVDLTDLPLLPFRCGRRPPRPRLWARGSTST